MYISDYRLLQEGGLFIKVKCSRCGKQPAFNYQADCHGDEVGSFCKNCWVIWFNEDFLPQLVENIDTVNEKVEVNSIDEIDPYYRKDYYTGKDINFNRIKQSFDKLYRLKKSVQI